MAIATDGSPTGFDAFIRDNNLQGMNHLSEANDPELVAEMMAEFKVDGMPTFVAIRGDGQYRSDAGWSEYWFERDIRWLED